MQGSAPNAPTPLQVNPQSPAYLTDDFVATQRYNWITSRGGA